MLMSSFDFVKIYESLICRILTFNHSDERAHVILALVIVTGLGTTRIVSDYRLTHFLDEEILATSK